MAKEREIFIHGQLDDQGNIIVPGCVRNGIDEKSANKIFDEMAEFAKYAFNKSHAACYAVIAYRTAYLKTYYPAEFMAATLNSFLGNLDKIPQYIDECKSLGIEILKPEINKSDTKFTTEYDETKSKDFQIAKLRFGLGSIKNVGIAPVEAIVSERIKKGPYKNFTDFCERIAEETENKKCIESLIKAGAFDEFGQTRRTLLASFESIIDTIQSEKKKGLSGQVSMFDIGSTEEKEKMNEVKYKYEEYEEMSNKDLLSIEKEMLGIYISGHPLAKLKDQIEKQTTINTLQLRQIDEQNNTESSFDEMMSSEKPQFVDGQKVKYAGIITSIKKKYTKNNKIMAFVTIEDLYGSAEIIVFENAYINSSKSLVEENIVMVDGRLSIREDDTSTIIASEIKDFGEQKQKIFTLNITNATEEEKDKLRGAIRYFQGNKNNINVQIKIDGETKPCGQIYLTDSIKEIFESLIGKENVTLEEK